MFVEEGGEDPVSGEFLAGKGEVGVVGFSGKGGVAEEEIFDPKEEGYGGGDEVEMGGALTEVGEVALGVAVFGAAAGAIPPVDLTPAGVLRPSVLPVGPDEEGVGDGLFAKEAGLRGLREHLEAALRGGLVMNQGVVE